MNRRERTHRLIELGELVVKSGLDRLLKDDRAALYGALLELVLQLGSEETDQIVILWRRRGQTTFRSNLEERGPLYPRPRHPLPKDPSVSS